jgi:outer membrane receptor protein involved in Fe transport
MATLSILNLTDTSYTEQPGTSFTDQGYPSPGRTITVGLKYMY